MTISLLSKLKTHLCTLATLILLGSQALIPSRAQAQYQMQYCDAPCFDTCDIGCGLRVYVDLLFWSDFYQNVYARDRGTNVGDTAFGRGRTVPVRLDPGFRLAAEYPLGCTGWNVYASYLWFYSGLHDSFSATSATFPDGSITPTVGIGGSGSTFRNGNAKLGNHVNHFELAARKDFCIGRSVLWRPYTGIAVAALKGKESYKFSTPGLTSGTVSFKTRSRASAWGIGPSAGAEFEWGYCEKWGIIGKASAAALIGNNVYSERSVLTAFGGGETVNGLVTDRFASIGLYWQASIGFISHLCFCGYNFDLGLECDTSRWTFKKNHFRPSGLTIKSGYAF